MEFDRRYAQLNPAQQKAVDTIDGPVLVVAGPGTGKTELLSVRTANIQQNRYTPGKHSVPYLYRKWRHRHAAAPGGHIR